MNEQGVEVILRDGNWSEAVKRAVRESVLVKLLEAESNEQSGN